MTDEQLDALWDIAEDAKQFPQESDHIWKLGSGMPWDECGPIVTNDNELTIVDEMRLPRREFGKHIATFDPPTVQALITALRTERTAHQATRAEVEAARDVVEAANRLYDCPGTCTDCPNSYEDWEAFADALDGYRVLTKHDAARAGQEG